MTTPNKIFMEYLVLVKYNQAHRRRVSGKFTSKELGEAEQKKNVPDAEDLFTVLHAHYPNVRGVEAVNSVKFRKERERLKKP